MLLKGTMGCGRSKPHSISSLEEVDKDCNSSLRKHSKSHACKKTDKSSRRLVCCLVISPCDVEHDSSQCRLHGSEYEGQSCGSKKEVKGILKQQTLQQHQLNRHHQVSSIQSNVQSQGTQRAHHRPLEQGMRASNPDQSHGKSTLQQKQSKSCPSKTTANKVSTNQCNNDDSHSSKSNGSTIVQVDGHPGSPGATQNEVDRRGGGSSDDKGSSNKKDQQKNDQPSKTAFKDKPSGKFYNTKITRSQLEFFRMLDEKIAQGKDYCSEDET